MNFLFLLHSPEFSLSLPVWLPSTNMVSTSLHENQGDIENSGLFLYLMVECSNSFAAFICNVVVNQGTAFRKQLLTIRPVAGK